MGLGELGKLVGLGAAAVGSAYAGPVGGWIGTQFGNAIGGVGSATAGTLGTWGTAIGNAVGPVIGDWGGTYFANEFVTKPNMEAQQKFNAEQAYISYLRSRHSYRHRYQWTAKDMEKAGLNPIMAMGSGFNVGQGVNAPVASTGPTPGPMSYQSTAKNLQVQSEIEERQARTNKQVKEAEEAIARIAKHRADTGKASAEENLALARYAEAYANLEKIRSVTELTNRERDYVIMQIRQMTAALEALENQSEIYSGPVGQLLSYLKWFSELIGLSTNAGVGTFRTKTIHGR